MSIITKGLIGSEDLSVGLGTFTRTTSTGGTNTLHKVNLGNLSGFPALIFMDGVTYTTVQAAINALPSTGGWVLIPPGTYVGPTTIPSHVHLTGFVPGLTAATIAAATSLVWGSPPADQKIIFTYTANLNLSSIWDVTIEGITFDFGGNNAGIVLQNGVFECHFGTPSSKICIQNCGTGTALTLSGGAVSGQSVVGNDFEISIFNAGKGIVLTATNPGVAANNRFHTIHIHNVSVRAWEFVQFADSNRCEWLFVSGLGNAADGVVFNTGSPAVDVGIYDNVFQHALLADPTNPGSYTGTLVKVNKTTHPNAILDWEIGPGITSGGGTILSNPSAYPFDAHVTTDFTDGNDGVFIGIVGMRDRTNTIPMGFTFKKGSGGGTYSSASTVFVAVDGTNLAFTTVIPLGWKMKVDVTGNIGTATAVAGFSVALADGGVILAPEINSQGSAIGIGIPFSLTTVITGDGNSHVIDLRYKTSNAADAVIIANATATQVTTMAFTMMPAT